MNNYKKYHPVNSLESPRFSEIRTFLRLPHVKSTVDVDFAAVGIPFDTGVTYRSGARFAPAAIRDVSAMIRPYNSNQQIDIYEYVSGIDYGDVPVVPGFIEASYKRIEEGLKPLFDANIIPIGLGGDHSITLAELRAASKKYGKIALVHMDAHLDTWDSYFGEKYNHGTPFRRAVEEGLIDVEHSITLGVRGSFYSSYDRKYTEDLGIKLLMINDIRENGIKETGRLIRERVQDKKAFLTFDIDFVDPTFAPGTGVYEMEGVSSHEALSLVRETAGIDFIGFDIVEVLPAFDPTEITACLAANIGFEFASIIALNKKNEIN